MRAGRARPKGWRHGANGRGPIPRVDVLLIVIGAATGLATLFGGALALRFRRQIPLILGASPTPDFLVCQLADRRGLLDAEFAAFLDAQRRLAAEHAAEARAETAWL